MGSKVIRMGRKFTIIAPLTALIGFGVATCHAQQQEPMQERQPIIATSYNESAKATHVTASILIEAKPAFVWSILTDCALAPKIIVNLESCKIIDKDSAAHWDLREHVINAPLLPRFTTLVRNEFIACRQLKFKLVEGDLRISDGSWKLQAQAGSTLLSYDALIAPKTTIPQFLIAQSIEHDFPTMLKALRDHSMKQARSSAHPMTC